MILLVLLVWLAATVGFLFGLFWAGRSDGYAERLRHL